MREHEPGTGIFGPPRGEPDRPLVEAAVVLAAFYVPAFLRFAPGASPGFLASPAFHAGLIAVNAMRALLVLYVIATGDGLAAFGLGRPRGIDPLKGLLAALGALAFIVPAAFLFSSLGLKNPLMALSARGSGQAPAIIPLFLASSLATGYAEELFFRCYLIRRLERAGMPPPAAIVASSLLFGAAHGAQGVVGVVSTTLIGLWFAWRWHDRRNIHEIALGHGIYDAAVIAFTLYS
jgi:membrane protease YdiL (CAAX protease family)